MKTFSIQVLGCKVNQYEAEQIATTLRRQGLVPAGQGEPADLRVVHTCSVTAEAGKKSAQTVRRMTRLPILQPAACGVAEADRLPVGAKTVVTGCWATSHPAAAAGVSGVDAVITNAEDVHARLEALVQDWAQPARQPSTGGTAAAAQGSSAGCTLPLPIDRHPIDRQSANQRAFLKIQDGCDAFCTYCIIPQLRPKLWSKPINECIGEAQALVDRGHVELVLTGIFMGAYGYPTALRRRQTSEGKCLETLATLVDALCTHVRGLKRLRLSSLEPGDLDANLIGVLKSHEQAVPHFHLPLQSGSDELLRRMNRQYRRDDFQRMIDDVHLAFDRPAITTDIIVGFPGETDAEFEQTLEIAHRARFIHTHAFTYSPRPRTAAARWTHDFVPATIANDRIRQLTQAAASASVDFRRQFVGETVEILVERAKADSTTRHGRCERYFDVQFPASPGIDAGSAVRVRVERVEGPATIGRPASVGERCTR